MTDVKLHHQSPLAHFGRRGRQPGDKTFVPARPEPADGQIPIDERKWEKANQKKHASGSNAIAAKGIQARAVGAKLWDFPRKN